MMLRDPEDEQARQSLRTLLDPLARGEDAPIERVVELPVAKRGAPAAAFQVLLRPDTRLVDRYPSGVKPGQDKKLADLTQGTTSVVATKP